jgi:hypothetical protein
MEESGQLHSLATLPQGKSSQYPLDRRLDGPQSQSGHGGEEKNSQPLPGLKPSFIQPVTLCYTIALSWLIRIFLTNLLSSYCSTDETC